MNLFGWFSTNFFPSTQPINSLSQHQVSSNIDINPASGLPMADGIGSIDIAGNTYGFNDKDMRNNISEFDSNAYDDWNFDNDFSGCDISTSSFD